MKWFKSTIDNELKQKLLIKDDSYTYREGTLGEGVFSDWIPADKLTYNYDITVEELKKEYDVQLEAVKNKVAEIKEYFDTFKGKSIDMSSTKYKLQEFTIIKPFSIGFIPMEISDDYDKEVFEDVLNFKMDKDTVYTADIYLDSYLSGIDGDYELEDAEYVIDRVEFVGLSECKMQHRALCLAIYNKIGQIFYDTEVYFNNFKELLEGDMTMKGFIKKIDITIDKKISC